MANRVKSAKPSPIQIPDWHKADDLVLVTGKLQKQIEQAENAANYKIDTAKAELARKVKPLQERIDLNVQSLELFCDSHKEDFKKARSKKLNFGVLGWRKSTFIKVKKTTLGLIKECLSRAQAAACIRIKESVDKEALARLTDEQLADVGARREYKDVFFVEPDLVEAAEL